MDGKLKTLQWEENSATRTPYDHSDRCVNKRLGAYCKEVSTGGNGQRRSNIYINVLGNKICNLNIHKAFVTFDQSRSSRQQSCSGISLEDGWYPQFTASKNQEVNLELSAISSDHNYCRVPSKQVECQNRLGVMECNRLIRLETSSESLSENNQILRNPNGRSICLRAVSPTSPIHGMEARSKQFCNRCNAAGLEQNV